MAEGTSIISIFKVCLLLATSFQGDIQHEITSTLGRMAYCKATKALPKLTDALGNNVDENLGALHGFEGILNERLFHKIITEK